MTQNGTISIQDFWSKVNRYAQQTDRATALMVSAWLDDALSDCILAAFRPDKSVRERLMRPDGPLGSLAARIDLAFALDLIEPTARNDLDLIRKIRNQFAHRREDIRFSTPSIRDQCRILHGATACRKGGLDVRTPKQRFIATAYFLLQYVIDSTRPRKRSPFLDRTDAYGAWIRSTVKSSMIRMTLGHWEDMQRDR